MAFVLIVAIAVVAAAAFSARRKLRILLSDRAVSDRTLYEQGRRDSDEKRKGDDGPLAKMLRDAGIETSPLMLLMCATAVLVTVGGLFFACRWRACSVCGDTSCLRGGGRVCRAGTAQASRTIGRAIHSYAASAVRKRS